MKHRRSQGGRRREGRREEKNRNKKVSMNYKGIEKKGEKRK